MWLGPGPNNIRLVIGRRLKQFLVEEQIGAGGMGIVYRAHDETLNRAVAIKVLPPGSIADQARDRFRQEASLLARVNHPNIATIHDFGQIDGVDFLVMEFISGQGLDSMISAGPMPEETIRTLGQQLCSGLEAAHQLGIVHRDLKPANLRVTPDQRLKILDFGLAKLLSAEIASDTAITQASVELTGLAGTLPYMAPEQVSGGVIDARTDIHAAGAVLYEMATGRAPFFSAVGPVALIAAILSKPPADPASLNPRVSRPLERTILRCLEKDPARRYRDARELGLDLQPAARAAIAGSAPNSVAVLPFDNLTNDQQIDYLRFALAETVTTTLSRARSVSVRPLASTRKYASDADLQDVGQALRVRVLITGAFASHPGALRVSVEATDAEDLRIIWSDTFTVRADLLVGVTQELRSRIGRDLLSAGTSVLHRRELRPRRLGGISEIGRRVSTSAGTRSRFDRGGRGTGGSPDRERRLAWRLQRRRPSGRASPGCRSR